MIVAKSAVLFVLLHVALGSRFRSLDLLDDLSRNVDDEDIGFDDIEPDYLPAGKPSPPEYRRHSFVGDEFILTRDIGKQNEVRLFYNGILAIETVIPELGEDGLFLREVTDGSKLLQLIYTNADTLADCDIDRSKTDVGEFVAKFYGTSQAKILNHRRREMKVDHAEISVNLEENGKTPDLKMITSRPLSGQNAAAVAFTTLKEECRRLHHRIERERRLTEGYNYQAPEREEILTNDRSFFDNHNGRSKRDVAAAADQPKSRVKRGMFIYPGTNWCGTGTSATEFHDLGEQRGTDKCCRTHDFCPYTIEGFTKKYGHFNYRFHTISHCECDIR